MPKIYAVRKGRKTGIFNNWTDVQENVNKYPGAQFKSFKTKQEAVDYLYYKPQQKQQKQQKETTSQENEPERKVKTTQESKNEHHPLEPPFPEGDVQVVYTDGACAGNGKFGAIAGVGVYFGTNDLRNVSEPLGEGRQTNQRAELKAVLIALKNSDPEQDLEIRTDSKYTINCATEWIKKWKRNGFKTSSGKEVENIDLVQAIDAVLESRSANVSWVHVAGHKGIFGNEMANDLAVAGAQK